MKLGCGGSFFIFIVFLTISTRIISIMDERDVENGENPLISVFMVAFNTIENKYLCFSYYDKTTYLNNENITFILPENSGEIKKSDYEKCKFETKEKTDEYILYEISYNNDDYSSGCKYKVYSKNNFKLTYSKMFHIKYMFMSVPIALVILLIISISFRTFSGIPKEKINTEDFDEHKLKKRERINNLFIKIRFIFLVSLSVFILLTLFVTEILNNIFGVKNNNNQFIAIVISISIIVIVNIIIQLFVYYKKKK